MGVGILIIPTGKERDTVQARESFIVRFGINAADTRRKTRENRAQAQMLAAQIEQAAQGSKRLKVVRKRFAAIISVARQTDAEQSGVTVRTYFDDWMFDKLPNVGTSYGNQLKLCKREFYTSLGNRADAEIVHIDEEDIENFVDSLVARNLGGRSINKRLDILIEMFGDGEDKAFVIVNPVNEDHYQMESPLERQAFSIPQTELILGATRIVDWHTMILLGFYCGMRLGRCAEPNVGRHRFRRTDYHLGSDQDPPPAPAQGKSDHHATAPRPLCALA